MTEYTYHSQALNEITDFFTLNAYLKQAIEGYRSEGWDMTFLPISREMSDPQLPSVNGYDWSYESRFGPNEKKAASYILKNTLLKTFAQNHPEHDSALIVAFACNAADNQNDADKKFYEELTTAVIYEQRRLDHSWFKKLSGAAQLAATALDSSLPERENIQFDLDRIDEKDRPALIKASNLLLNKAYECLNKTHHIYDPVSVPQYDWETKAAALKIQLSEQGYRCKIPLVHVFADLMTTAQTSDQLKRLADMLPSNRNVLDRQNFSPDLSKISANIHKIPTHNSASVQKLFYSLMYKMGMDINVTYGMQNYQALQNAKQECEAQQSIDQLKAQKTITNIPYFDSVMKYRPELLMHTQKMTPHLCLDILNKMHGNLPTSVQLNLMNRALENESLSLKEIDNLLSYAAELKTSSKKMQTFLDNVEPLIEKQTKAYKDDQARVAEAEKAGKDYETAQNEYSALTSAYTDYCQLLNICAKIKNNRSDKDPQPSDEVINAFLQERIAGRDSDIAYTPKSGLAKLFLSSQEKERQAQMQKFITELKAKTTEIVARSPSNKYLSVALDNRLYWETQQKMYENVKQKRNEYNNYYDLDICSNNIKNYEQINLPQKAEAIKERYKLYCEDVQAKARIDLGMRFGGQEFNGEPMQGLLDEDTMAQEIYKREISKLQRKIQKGVKQDLKDREVDQKPSIENPNETGIPMSPENTSEIRSDMKKLKDYRDLVK